MEVRIALALCVVLGCTLCGKALADAARRRALALEGLSEGLRLLRIHMTTLLEPVQSALRQAGCPVLALVAEGMTGGAGAGEAWNAAKGKASRRGGAAETLSEKDMQLLDRLFARLGQSGREEQDALLAGAILEADRLRDAARAKAREADRLYVSLGLLIGLMLALIVI